MKALLPFLPGALHTCAIVIFAFSYILGNLVNIFFFCFSLFIMINVRMTSYALQWRSSSCACNAFVVVFFFKARIWNLTKNVNAQFCDIFHLIYKVEYFFFIHIYAGMENKNDAPWWKIAYVLSLYIFALCIWTLTNVNANGAHTRTFSEKM